MSVRAQRRSPVVAALAILVIGVTATGLAGALGLRLGGSGPGVGMGSKVGVVDHGRGVGLRVWEL